MTQRAPLPNDSRRILDYVLDDLRARAEQGKKKDGVYLQAHNGRDALQDAYEEALDLSMYLRQAIEERDGARRTLLTLLENEWWFSAQINRLFATLARLISREKCA